MNSDYIMRYLDDAEIDIFELSNLAKVLKQPVPAIQSNIETLLKRGLLNRIEKGKYCRHNFRNEFVIANFLAPEGAIAYWSALNFHGLTNQFPNTVFIQTTKLKRDKKVFGVNYQFIKVKPQKVVGYKNSGVGNNTFKITNVEKTIVDCFDLPQYSGGHTELFFALKKAKLNANNLIEACKAVNNISATKRIGYLIELYQKPAMHNFIKYALSCIKVRYDLLDQLGKNLGKFDKSWKLRLNISETDIIAMSKKEY